MHYASESWSRINSARERIKGKDAGREEGMEVVTLDLMPRTYLSTQGYLIIRESSLLMRSREGWLESTLQRLTSYALTHWYN